MIGSSKVCTDILGFVTNLCVVASEKRYFLSSVICSDSSQNLDSHSSSNIVLQGSIVAKISPEPIWPPYTLEIVENRWWGGHPPKPRPQVNFDGFSWFSRFLSSLGHLELSDRSHIAHTWTIREFYRLESSERHPSTLLCKNIGFWIDFPSRNTPCAMPSLCSKSENEGFRSRNHLYR